MLNRRGATLIEVLISFLIIVLASIGTLQYFGVTRGFIGKTGNRRAALERARERVEQFMASKVSDLPPQDGSCYYCADDTCTGTSWTSYVCGTVPVSDDVPVEDQGRLRRETFASFIDDPSANTGVDTLDVYELGVKVWFTNTATDDEFHRIHLRTLRTP